ncbi:MAG: hypothetical protein KF847_20435 [Pirellulales bacterium]|nr:hypothetical protein [Pirellulales bacterium]
MAPSNPDNTEELTLYERDFTAADEVLQRWPCSPDTREDYRRKIAESHARLGNWNFRLHHGLRPPRTPLERLTVEGEPTQEYWAPRIAEDERRPIDCQDLDALQEDLAELLGLYARFLELGRGLASVARRLPNPDRYRRTLDYLARECQIDPVTSCTGKRYDRILALAEEVRLLRGGPTPKFGWITASTQIAIACRAPRVLSQLWRRLRSGGFEIFGRTVASEYLPPDQLMAALDEEFAAVRLHLREHSEVGQHPFSQPVSAPAPTSAAANPGNEVQRAAPGPAKPVKFAKWAVAQETTGKWWLFRKIQGRWQRRGRVRIPKGNAERLMQLLVEGRGALSGQQAIERMRPFNDGRSARELRRCVTDALAKAKAAIRQSMARARRSADWQGIPNPIPNDGAGWRALIEVGLAVPENGSHAFQPRR